MNLVPPKEEPETYPILVTPNFVPESDEELELWTRFACAALEGGSENPLFQANEVALEHRRLRQGMKARQPYR